MGGLGRCDENANYVIAETVLRAAVALTGVLGAVWSVSSAVRTMVIPRPERVWITMAAFNLARRFARWLASRTTSADRRHHILGAFAPIVLISLPAIWSVSVIISFSAIFWALLGGSWFTAIELSGSSLTTLGFTLAPTFLTRLIAIAEALIGLALVALVISFLPTFYSTFSDREIAVGKITVRAGEPPTTAEFLIRLHQLGRLEHMGERWADWEEWFVKLGETHTSFPALIYFRSDRPERSWLAAAETALDSAVFVTATRLVPSTGQAETMIRSGYLALRTIADFYQVGSGNGGLTRSGGNRTDISIKRESFNSLWERIEAGGIKLSVDQDQAWKDFIGWRMNYEDALMGLKQQVGDVPSHWTMEPAPGG